MIIDSHTHFYPDFVIKSPVEWALSAQEIYWAELVGKRPDGKLSLQGFPDEKKFLSDMDSAQVDHAIIQGWYWQNHETCQLINEHIARLIKRYPDRLSAFAAIQPADSRAIEIAKSARDMGFCGFGEIHDGVQNFSYASKNFELFAELAQAQDMPLCLHITEETDRQYLGKCDTNTKSAIAVAKKFPKLNIIFAHWCGNALFEKTNFPQNAYFDSAATPLIAKVDAWEEGVNASPTRAIYGSDYPLRLYPRKFKVEEMQTIANEARANVPSEHAKKFFEENIKKLIKK